MTTAENVAVIIEKFQPLILEEWLQTLKTQLIRLDANSELQLRQQCVQFLKLFVQAGKGGRLDDIEVRG